MPVMEKLTVDGFNIQVNWILIPKINKNSNALYLLFLSKIVLNFFPDRKE